MMPRQRQRRRRRRIRAPQAKPHAYRQLWRVVDGAVRSTILDHPEYLTEWGRNHARLSLVKRIVGQVMSYAAQAAQGRSGFCPAPETADDEVIASPATPQLPTAAGRREAMPAGRPLPSTAGHRG